MRNISATPRRCRLNLRRLALAGGVFCASLAWTNRAHADALNLTSAGYGVGTSVNQGGVNPVSGTNFQNNVTSTNVVLSTALLKADVSTSPLTIGAESIDTHGPGTPAFVEVVAADGFSVTGGPATAHFTITGTFAPGNVDSSFFFRVGTYAAAAANSAAGNPFPSYSSGISFVGNGLGPSGWEYSYLCPLGPCGYIPWGNGAPVTLDVPVTSADNGIIVDLGGFASGDPNPYIINFYDPVTVSFVPSPGGSVTLATGQVFTNAPVPEPSSLLLLGTGLLGILGAARRKRLS